SRPLDDDRRGLDGWVEPHLGLAHADARTREREAGEELVRDGCRERLDQPVPRGVADAADELPVVDRLLDPVGLGVRRQLELEVEHEPLSAAPLLLADAVMTDELEARELDRRHVPTTARATASASTVSRTSWTRRIVAPRSYALTAAARLAESGPVVAVASPAIRPSELLREKPITTGRPSARRTSSRRTSSKFWSTVLPKPMPGSRQTRPSGIPAATATPSRSSRKAATSPATSSYRGSTCMVRGSPRMCIRQR